MQKNRLTSRISAHKSHVRVGVILTENLGIVTAKELWTTNKKKKKKKKTRIDVSLNARILAANQLESKITTKKDRQVILNQEHMIP